MSVYFDASILVSLFISDDLSSRAQHFLEANRAAPVVSDFAAAEFASAINRLVRMKALKTRQAMAVFSSFDQWRSTSTILGRTQSGDVVATEALLRRLDLPLRTPDVLNIAIARRLGLRLATFDARLANSARLVGVACAPA